MKRFLLTALIISVLAMSGCGNDNIETTVTENTVISVTESVTESETTATTDVETVSETTMTTTVETALETTETTTEITTETTTEIAEQELVLRPIPTGEEINAFECTLTELELSEDETLIPEALLKKAKQRCWESFDSSYREEGFVVGSAEEVLFGKGGAYDFDLDGEDEYIFVMSAAHDFYMEAGFVAYCDGENVYGLLVGCNPHMEIEVMDYDGYRFMKLHTEVGATAYSEDIYRFNDGVPEFEINAKIMASNHFNVCGNVIYCRVKYDFLTYPLIFCEDGQFRWFAVESITEDDFKARVENGGAYLDRLKADGNNIKEIGTCGNYVYYLSLENGDNYVLSPDENGVYFIEKSWGYLGGSILEAEFIYGGDVWSVV